MLSISIELSKDAHTEIKNDLTKSLPSTKSSHRVEALARSLGFSSNASLLASLNDVMSVSCRADGLAFQAFMSSRNSEVDLNFYYLAIAREAVRAAMNAERRLNEWGIGAGRPKRKPEGGFETPREHFRRMQEARENMTSDYFVKQFLLSTALLARIGTKTKTVRSGAGSYRLKHIAENYASFYPDGSPLGPFYVQDGAMIAAAIHAGFDYKTYVDELGYDVTSVTFNMPKKVIDQLDFEIRGRGRPRAA